MIADANQEGQQERRRASFTKWLLSAWEHAAEDHRNTLANSIADLLSHADEDDYPLWEMARKRGLIGDGRYADELRKACGIPIATPVAVGWEREIGFSPVIPLEEEVYSMIFHALGWANRTPDPNSAVDNFFLWSPTGNIVRFIKRVKTRVEEEG